MKKIILTLAFTFGMLNSSYTLASSCIGSSELMRAGVLIENGRGKGLGSGVLYDKNIIITSASAIDDSTALQVFLPRINKAISATILYANKKPNLAILKISEEQDYAEPLTLARTLLKGEHLKFVSFPFSERQRLGVADAQMHTLARFKSASRLEYFNAFLKDWGFYGDQGGVLFNCRGEITGVHLGPLSLQQNPEHIYAVHVRAIADALKQAGIKVRRAY